MAVGEETDMLMQSLTDLFSNFFPKSNWNIPFELYIVQRDKKTNSSVAPEKNEMSVSYTDRCHHCRFLIYIFIT